jgi:hypothetical protein
MSIRTNIAAGWSDIHGENIVTATKRFVRHIRADPAKVWGDVRVCGHSGADLTFFQGPLLFGCVNDAEVIDAGIGLRGLTGFHEVGNRDRSQEANDGHHDHDFNQRESRPGIVPSRFHSFAFSFYGGTQQQADLYDDCFCSNIACRNRNLI